jgi:hypothetical protein
MERYIYFDVLDTAKTKLGGTEEEQNQAGENRFRGQAEIKMSILCGWIPVFPQNSGWDSSALLDYGAEESFSGKAYFWLVQNGFIRFRLRNSTSLWNAAINAFKSPDYKHLSAWPEFNTDNPVEARRPLVDIMSNWDQVQKYSAALPETVWSRLHLLRELSTAVEQAPREMYELPREDKLSGLIKAAARNAITVDTKMAALLYRCTTDVPDPNNRTVIDAFLDRERAKIGDLALQAREITNGCFNTVAAECIRALPALTLPSCMPLAFDVLRQTLPTSIQSDIYEATIGETEVPELNAVSWIEIADLLTKCRTYSVDERVREAEVTRLIARAAVERVDKYVMKIERKNRLYNSAVWGGAGLVGAAGGFIGEHLAGAGGSIAGAILASTVASGLAGDLGTGDIRKKEKDKISSHLEEKYRGLIPSWPKGVKAPSSNSFSR